MEPVAKANFRIQVLTRYYYDSKRAPGTKKAHVQEKGMSLNALIVALIERDMGSMTSEE